MAFNDRGPRFWLAPGATVTRTYSDGWDHGAQYAMARLHTPDSLVYATRQGKTWFQAYWGPFVTYYVTLHNEGPQWAYCSLDGGGLA